MVILTSGSSRACLGGMCHFKDWHSIQKEYSACEKKKKNTVKRILDSSLCICWRLSKLSFWDFKNIGMIRPFRRNCAMPVNFLPLKVSIIYIKKTDVANSLLQSSLFKVQHQKCSWWEEEYIRECF